MRFAFTFASPWSNIWTGVSSCGRWSADKYIIAADIWQYSLGQSRLAEDLNDDPDVEMSTSTMIKFILLQYILVRMCWDMIILQLTMITNTLPYVCLSKQ